MFTKIIRLFNGSFIVYPGPGVCPEAGFNVTADYPSKAMYGEEYTFEVVSQYANEHPEIMEFEPEPPSLTLDELKSTKWEQIKAKRDALEIEPLPYLGKILDFDEKSSKRLDWAVSTAQTAVMTGQAFTVNWTCADDSTLTLPAQDILGIPLAVAQRSDTLHQIARGLREDIFGSDTNPGATTAEELDLISWPE